MKSFEDVWDDILILIQDDGIVYTLTEGKKNTVQGIIPEGLLVSTDKGKSKLVKKDWIKDTWDALALKRAIVADDIPGRARYRSSFIMALLSKLSYIKSINKPNTLYLNFGDSDVQK